MATVEQRARLLEPGSLVSLFEFDLSPQGSPDPPLYFHPHVEIGAGTLAFMGKTYQPFPIQITGLDFNTSGTLPRPKIIVSNIDSIVTALLRQYGDFVTCILTRRRTYVEFLDDGANHGTAPDYVDAQQYEPDIFSVERKSQETGTFVEFELSGSWDAEGVSLPRRQILAGFCPWQYRGVECTFIGPPVSDKDDKPINVAHIVTPLTTTADSPSVVIPSGAFTFNQGHVGAAMSGIGIPFGTTIFSVENGTHATMTNNATASGTITATIFSTLFDATKTYALGQWVYTGTPITDIPDTTLRHYRSLVASNNFALSNTAKWYQTGQAYDAAHTYVLGDYAYVMVAGIRVYYASLADANTSPLTDKTKWVRDDCSKRIFACKARFGQTNPLPFGGMPGAAHVPGG